MKRISILLTLVLGLAFINTSCEKTPENEWNRFYGYTANDIAGHYDANPDESLYEELPTQGVAVYDNATVEIQALSENQVSLRIIIPNVINRVFSGTVFTDESVSDLILHNFQEDISMTVYKNKENQIRLHGRVKRYRYDQDNVLVDSDNYGFDVIKE